MCVYIYIYSYLYMGFGACKVEGLGLTEFRVVGLQGLGVGACIPSRHNTSLRVFTGRCQVFLLSLCAS